MRLVKAREEQKRASGSSALDNGIIDRDLVTIIANVTDHRRAKTTLYRYSIMHQSPLLS